MNMLPLEREPQLLHDSLLLSGKVNMKEMVSFENVGKQGQDR